MVDLTALEGFDWDNGNRDKNWLKHQVTWSECEEPFFNSPLLLNPARPCSQTETRYYVLGQTNAGRLLFIVFTFRKDKIRVISARDMSRKERDFYATTNS
jgi:uncharacterized DUF497 family protein